MERSAALRAEWLARLAEAIEGAQRVAWQLRTSDENASVEARELYSRLEAVRLELQTLRGVVAAPGGAADADWLKKLGWMGSLAEPHD